LEGTAEFFHLSVVHSLSFILILRPNALGNFITPDLLWVLAIEPVFMIEFVPLPGEELSVPPWCLVSEVEELVTELTSVEWSEKLEVGDSNKLSAKLLRSCPAKDRVDGRALLNGLHLIVPHHLAFGAICISRDLTIITEAYLALVDKLVGEPDIFIFHLVTICVILCDRGDRCAEGPVVRLNHLFLDCSNFDRVCFGVELRHHI